jgi:hypothetical protein
MRQTTDHGIKILEGDFIRYNNGAMSLSHIDINLNIDSVKAVYSPQLLDDVWQSYDGSYSGTTFREWFNHQILNRKYIILKQEYKREENPTTNVEFDMDGKKYRITEVTE